MWNLKKINQFKKVGKKKFVLNNTFDIYNNLLAYYELQYTNVLDKKINE